MSAPYPCYCQPGAARCDDPYNWCDRNRELLDAIGNAAREWLYETRHADEPTTPGEFANTLMPLIERACWEKAAAEVRRAADDGARLRVGIPRTWGWLRDRAGVMDGGAR